ncbi:hypothetical protein L9F63_021418, partial [Diploptera punctata]
GRTQKCGKIETLRWFARVFQLAIFFLKVCKACKDNSNNNNRVTIGEDANHLVISYVKRL